MEKQLILEFAEVILGWNGKVSDVSLRVSVQGIPHVLKVKGSATVQLKNAPNDLQIHMLAQSGNIALASVTTRLSTLFQGSKDAFEKVFDLNVPANVVKILVPGVNSAKIVKIKLLGRYSKGNLKEKSRGKLETITKKTEEDRKSERSEGKLEDIKVSIDEVVTEKNENTEEEKKTEELRREEQKRAGPDVLVQSNKLCDENKGQKVREDPKLIPDFKNLEGKSEDTPPSKTFLPLLPLSTSSIHSNCPYIKSIKLSEFHYSEISRILASLKAEMGANFQKFIQESIRRDSKPTSVRRLTNTGMSSPRKGENSQLSFTSTGKQEENIIDIPSSAEVFIEKLNIKSSHQLICVLTALLGKLTYFEAINSEIKILKEGDKLQDEYIGTLKKSLVESQEEISLECGDSGNGSKLIAEIKDRIQKKKHLLEEKKQQKEVLNHEKHILEEKLKNVKAENTKIKLESDPSGKIAKVLKLRNMIENLENQRNHLEDTFKNLSLKEQEDYCNITAEQIRVAELKSSLCRRIKDYDQESNNFSRENWNLSNQITRLEGISDICADLETLLQENSSEISMIKSESTTLSNSLLQIKGAKDDCINISESHSNHLQESFKKYEEFINNLQNESNNIISNSSKLAGECKKSSAKSVELESMISAYLDLHIKFESLRHKLEQNKEIKDQVISEIDFFSDFVFSLSQTFLQQSRISHKVKAIVEEKDFDVQAMRESLAHFKLKNPVYHPAKTDSIDKALADYLNSRNSVLPLPFVRESFGIYYFGTKKINISQERNKLMIKVGGGFLPIDEFIDNYTEIELEKFEKRYQDIPLQMRKLMAKWVGGITGDPDLTRGDIKEALVHAAKEQKYTTAYAIKENTPKKFEKFESFEEPVRAETPIIGDD